MTSGYFGSPTALVFWQSHCTRKTSNKERDPTTDGCNNSLDISMALRTRMRMILGELGMELHLDFGVESNCSDMPLVVLMHRVVL